VKRWQKRFWLRYPLYSNEHRFIAASIIATLLWVLWQVIAPLGMLLEIVLAVF